MIIVVKRIGDRCITHMPRSHEVSITLAVAGGFLVIDSCESDPASGYCCVNTEDIIPDGLLISSLVRM